jgi:hypothetical protein
LSRFNAAGGHFYKAQHQQNGHRDTDYYQNYRKDRPAIQEFIQKQTCEQGQEDNQECNDRDANYSNRNSRFKAVLIVIIGLVHSGEIISDS